MGIASVNPATGEILKTFTPLTSEELAAKLALAETTFQQYRRTAISQR
ncbi:MAG: NADP-dependent succinic semialdehyde dehydrogenase, partial [Microcystis panniformis]